MVKVLVTVRLLSSGKVVTLPEKPPLKLMALIGVGASHSMMCAVALKVMVSAEVTVPGLDT